MADEGVGDGIGETEFADGAGEGEGEGAGEGEILTAMTTTIIFCPCAQCPAFPLMKKKGPDRSSKKTVSPSSNFLIGLLVLQE